MISYDSFNNKLNTNIYKSHYETLKWTHSPFNPVIQSQWDEILQNTNLELLQTTTVS